MAQRHNMGFGGTGKINGLNSRFFFPFFSIVEFLFHTSRRFCLLSPVWESIISDLYFHLSSCSLTLFLPVVLPTEPLLNFFSADTETTLPFRSRAYVYEELPAYCSFSFPGSCGYLGLGRARKKRWAVIRFRIERYEEEGGFLFGSSGKVGRGGIRIKWT